MAGIYIGRVATAGVKISSVGKRYISLTFLVEATEEDTYAKMFCGNLHFTPLTMDHTCSKLLDLGWALDDMNALFDAVNSQPAASVFPNLVRIGVVKKTFNDKESLEVERIMPLETLASQASDDALFTEKMRARKKRRTETEADQPAPHSAAAK